MSELGRYLTKNEKKYRELRKKTLSKINAQTIADNPFLFANRTTVTETIARYEIFKKIINISGAIIECGVHNGNNLLLFSHLSSILEPYAINRKIIGFDTFEGFRSIEKEDPEDITENNFDNVNLEALKDAINLYDMNRAVGHMKRVEIIKGDAVKTIGDYVKNNPALTVALLYLDFDIYKPTKIALEKLFPLVCKGGVIAFDEFNYDKFPGETEAVKEFFKVNDMKFERFYFDPFIAYTII
tara:strand:+ start:1030 stop:1755 length:726 start_codon:yes stop_codon:yes gene_type:complete